MKDTKTEFKFFTIFEWKKEESYLREQHKNEYIQTFYECGWEYLQNFFGYSYFRKAVSEMDGTEEEIFCDDDSRLDMMKRVFRKRMIPLLCILFLIIIPQIIIQSYVNTPENHVLAAIFCIMFGVYLALFIAFAVQYRKYYKGIYR